MMAVQVRTETVQGNWHVSFSQNASADFVGHLCNSQESQAVDGRTGQSYPTMSAMGVNCTMSSDDGVTTTAVTASEAQMGDIERALGDKIQFITLDPEVSASTHTASGETVQLFNVQRVPACQSASGAKGVVVPEGG